MVACIGLALPQPFYSQSLFQMIQHALNCAFAQQRVHLDIQVGEHANDYAQIAAKDKLSELQLRVRQLIEQVEQIQKEQNYQRVRILLFIILLLRKHLRK